MSAGNVTSQVRFLLSDNPFITNEELYRLTKAFTKTEKMTVRVAKHRILNKIHNKPALDRLRAKQPLQKEKIRRLPKNFPDFVKQAFPYNTLYKWQYELFQHLEANDMSLVVVARDHGKSVLLAMYIQWLLDVKKMDVLLLGWTDRRKRIAEFVYAYIMRKNLISDDSIVKNTSAHFATKDDVRFDCYGVRDKAVLGMHADVYASKEGLCLIIDDPIDESFENYKSKARDLVDRWESTISNINPDKTVICGTRKYEGDFLEYIKERYGDAVSLFFRTPYNADGTLLCPERWTMEKLAIKRTQIGEYRFSSEYMGDPQPLTGGVWVEEDIEYASKLKKYSEYETVCIAVDPAWTTKPDSDNTSIDIVFKGKEKEGRREYIVFHDISGKFRFDGILDRIETNFRDIRDNFSGVNIFIAIEKNGGGQILIDAAINRNYDFAPYILPVQHTRAKEERIMTLEVPIKNHTIKFMEDLKGSELIFEILTFPKCKKFDALDALSMAFTELEKMRKRKFMIRRKRWY